MFTQFEINLDKTQGEEFFGRGSTGFHHNFVFTSTMSQEIVERKKKVSQFHKGMGTDVHFDVNFDVDAVNLWEIAIFFGE